MLNLGYMDHGGGSHAAPNWDRRYRIIRKALIRSLGLRGTMNREQRVAVHRAALLSVAAERGALDPDTPVDHLQRIDRHAQRAREAVALLAKGTRRPTLAECVNGSNRAATP